MPDAPQIPSKSDVVVIGAGAAGLATAIAARRADRCARAMRCVARRASARAPHRATEQPVPDRDLPWTDRGDGRRTRHWWTVIAEDGKRRRGLRVRTRSRAHDRADDTCACAA